MLNIDLLIAARWLITIEPEGEVLDNHAVAVNEGKIVEVLPRAQARHKYTAKNTFELDQHALLPGFVNTHTHASMSLFRGLADDLPLMQWLEQHIWPAEAKWVNSEFVCDGTELAIAEMIRGGTTCFNDMYFFPDQTARVVDQMGIRAVVGLIMIDFPTVWAGNADEYLSKGLEVHDRYRNHPRIATAFAPHAPYTVSDEPLQRIVTLAEELDLPIHMHVHETAFEVNDAEKQSAKRPLQRLNELGLLSPRLIAVHMTQLNDEEIEIMAAKGAHVAHCPESNLKLASGYCPVAHLIQQGVNVALGTDGAASNNDLDMIGEMRTAALLAKAVAEDASALPAAQTLSMATLNGAKALGLDTLIGSVKPGKFADLIAIDLHAIATQPVYNPISQIVYAAQREQVSHVWVAGQALLRDKQLLNTDITALLHKAQLWSQKIAPNNAGDGENSQ